MISADIPQAINDTIFETSGVLKRGDEMGWQTAINLSADIINRKMDEVNWVMDVLIM